MFFDAKIFGLKNKLKKFTLKTIFFFVFEFQAIKKKVIYLFEVHGFPHSEITWQLTRTFSNLSADVGASGRSKPRRVPKSNGERDGLRSLKSTGDLVHQDSSFDFSALQLVSYKPDPPKANRYESRVSYTHRLPDHRTVRLRSLAYRGMLTAAA